MVLHENGENSAHFVDSFGFTELPKFMLTLEGKENEIETELAVHIADCYILMHECDEGYDSVSYTHLTLPTTERV